MIASSRFVVGIHILVALAGKALVCGRFGMPATVRSDELAESVNTNPVVIRRILSALHKAGLVISKAGRYGGSTLGRAPEDITLRDVYEAVEDEGLFRGHQQSPSSTCPVGCCIIDVVEEPLRHAELAMKEALSEQTIGDLVQIVATRNNIFEKLDAGYTYEQFKAEFEEKGFEMPAV